MLKKDILISPILLLCAVSHGAAVVQTDVESVEASACYTACVRKVIIDGERAQSIFHGNERGGGGGSSTHPLTHTG